MRRRVRRRSRWMECRWGERYSFDCLESGRWYLVLHATREFSRPPITRGVAMQIKCLLDIFAYFSARGGRNSSAKKDQPPLFVSHCESLNITHPRHFQKLENKHSPNIPLHIPPYLTSHLPPSPLPTPESLAHNPPSPSSKCPPSTPPHPTKMRLLPSTLLPTLSLVLSLLPLTLPHPTYPPNRFGFLAAYIGQTPLPLPPPSAPPHTSPSSSSPSSSPPPPHPQPRWLLPHYHPPPAPAPSPSSNHANSPASFRGPNLEGVWSSREVEGEGRGWV